MFLKYKENMDSFLTCSVFTDDGVNQSPKRRNF